MTVVVIMAIGAGLGLVGMVVGIRGRTPSLQHVLSSLAGDEGSGRLPAWNRPGGHVNRLALTRLAQVIGNSERIDHALATRLALADSSLEELCSHCLVGAAVGFLFPLLAGGMVTAGGFGVPVPVVLGASVLFGIGGALLPVAELNAAAKRGRRHAKRVICSFLDLVVLGLAGGMGIESALLTAAQLGENVVSRRMLAALSRCRDSGEPPWEALARLGETLGIEELGELAATSGLAGTEGAKVRATLAARAASLRRHELANAEAEANALTEKLFLPGAFLLIGFLIFIGYPAFTRIASGA